MEATTVKPKRSLRKKAGDVSEPVEISDTTPPITDQLNENANVLEVSDPKELPKENVSTQNPEGSKQDPKQEPKQEPKKEPKKEPKNENQVVEMTRARARA